MSYHPKVVLGTVKNTNTLLDGLTLSLALWDYDNHSSYHLWGYENKDKVQFIKAMKQADDLYDDMPLDEFIKLYESGEYDPPGSYCIDLDKVDVIRTLHEEMQP